MTARRRHPAPPAWIVPATALLAATLGTAGCGGPNLDQEIKGVAPPPVSQQIGQAEVGPESGATLHTFLAGFAAGPGGAPNPEEPGAPPAPPLDLPAPQPPPDSLEGRPLAGRPAEELAIRGMALYDEGRHADSAHVLHYAVAAGADQRYNLACSLALDGQAEPAFYWLQEAAHLEGVDADHAASDPDLVLLRNDDRWPRVRAYLERSNRYWAASGIASTELTLPAGYQHGTPIGLAVGLHGLGSNAADFSGPAWQRFADEANLAIVSVSGTRPSGPKSFAWAEDPEQDHAHVQRQLAALGDRVTIDPERVALFGFSQGGLVAYQLATTYPDAYRGALVMSPGGLDLGTAMGFHPLKVLPDAPAPRLILTCGAKEAAGNVALARRLDQVGRQSGASVTLILAEDQSTHAFPADFGNRFPAWTAYLLGDRDEVGP